MFGRQQTWLERSRIHRQAGGAEMADACGRFRCACHRTFKRQGELQIRWRHRSRRPCVFNWLSRAVAGSQTGEHQGYEKRARDFGGHVYPSAKQTVPAACWGRSVHRRPSFPPLSCWFETGAGCPRRQTTGSGRGSRHDRRCAPGPVRRDCQPQPALGPQAPFRASTTCCRRSRRILSRKTRMSDIAPARRVAR